MGLKNHLFNLKTSIISHKSLIEHHLLLYSYGIKDNIMTLMLFSL